MQEAYLNIYGVPTRVQTWGRWVEESYNKSEPENLVLFIPGNPGVTQFYTSFLKRLHEELGYTVWILSHAGHELPKSKQREAPRLTDNEKIYGLEGQVNHKLAFIDTYVPKNAQVYFVGHSIGAYVILDILKKSWVESNTKGAYLLFPAIEYLAETENGWYMVNVVQYFVRILLFLAWIFTILPFVLQFSLIKGYVLFYSILNVHLRTIINFIRPDVVDKVLYLAMDEMHNVKERETRILLENKTRIKLYYAANDGWSPQRYCKQLKRDIPDIDAEICTRNFEHAFVLRHPEEVAVMVAQWIKH